MKRRHIVLCAVLVLVAPDALMAKNRFLKGQVLLVEQHDQTTPAVGVTVTIKERGDSVRTLAQGLFHIFLPDAFKPGDRVTLLVDKKDWVIQYPLDGEARIPADLEKDLVEVRLLPAGSRKLWSADRIEKFIQDVAAKAKEQVKPEGKPQEVDFSQYIKDWAARYGFTAQQAKAEIDKWVAEVEKTQEDFHKLGLAAYAKKNFAEASKLFTESAETKANRLQALSQEKERLTEETVRDFRLAGDAHYNNYAFDKALAAYERALRYLSREKTPRLWTSVVTEIGLANREIGIRTEGPAVHQHLGAAVAAYRQALEVYTRTALPQDWAMTQNNLGNALREQGIRSGGEEGRRLLAEAVTAYRQALEVYTRTALPQEWATTQNNLGNALANQGTRTEGAEGQRLLAEAVTAFRQALEVRTREGLPLQWAQTQNNLAGAYLYLQDWPNAASSYLNVLGVYPDYAQAYQTANSIYHEKLFAFSEAFALNQQWLAQHPNDVSAQMNFAEGHFTTGRFTEAQARLAALLVTPDLEARARVALQTLEIATLLALNKPGSIPGKVEVTRAAVASQPEDFKLGWTFDGTKHFITQNESLAPYREWLLGLIAAVGEKDRNTILAALDTTRANFLAAVKN